MLDKEWMRTESLVDIRSPFGVTSPSCGPHCLLRPLPGWPTPHRSPLAVRHHAVIQLMGQPDALLTSTVGLPPQPTCGCAQIQNGEEPTPMGGDFLLSYSSTVPGAFPKFSLNVRGRREHLLPAAVAKCTIVSLYFFPPSHFTSSVLNSRSLVIPFQINFSVRKPLYRAKVQAKTSSDVVGHFPTHQSQTSFIWPFSLSMMPVPGVLGHICILIVNAGLACVCHKGQEYFSMSFPRCVG